jgi:hypothetical protein
MTYSYSIGDEPSSSNYRPTYCDKCGADTQDQCICKTVSSSYIADQLFLEICERGPLVDDPSNSTLPITGLATMKINKYYLEAAKYAGRISAGDFSNPGTPKPVFKLDAADFSPEIQAHLVEAKKCGMLNVIVKEAVFKLFRARHKMIFYEHIEPQKFAWEFITN